MGNLSYIHVVKNAFIDILVENNRNIHRIKVFFHSKMFKKIMQGAVITTKG